MEKIRLTEFLSKGDGEFTVELLKPSVMRDRRFPLTAKQGEILDYVVEYMGGHMYPPTFREIQGALKIINPGSVHKVLVALARKGYIIKDKGKSRGVWPIDEVKHGKREDQGKD